MQPRPRKLNLGMKITAVLCAVVWLFAVNLCNAKYLVECCSLHHHEEHAATDHHHDHSSDAEHVESEHSHDGDGDSHDSHPHNGDEGSCCSTLQALIENNSSFSKVSPPVSVTPYLWAITDALTPSFASDELLKRQAKSREWTFTPEVCLGPALRSHAPPSSPQKSSLRCRNAA